MLGMDDVVADHDRVLIKQTKEWGEIMLGFESKNRFQLLDEGGQKIGYAAEEAKGVGQWFLRNLFGRCREAKIHIYDPSGAQIGRGEKPFRWFFHRMEVFDGDNHIGTIQRKWSLFERLFAVERLLEADDALARRSWT